MSLEYWFMFPIAVPVLSTAMASGIGGATFFAPIFLLGLGLAPEVAVGTGLDTGVFGFASGLYAYTRIRLIDYRLGGTLLVATIPLALVGTWVSGRVYPEILKGVLGELNGYFSLQRCRVPSRAAVATGVFVAAFTALSAASGHLLQFARSGQETLGPVAATRLFSVPGVVIGGQLGSPPASRISQHTLEPCRGILFTLVAVITLGEVLL
jgi:uncharacterized membrane protein YfcA